MANRFLYILFLATGIININHAQTFKDVALEAGINGLNSSNLGGATIIDYNNDGLEDLYITGGYSRDILYKNNGDGTFSNRTNLTGFVETADFVTSGVTAGDINNDGFRDIFITTVLKIGELDQYAHNLLYLNKGDGTFENITETANIDPVLSYSASPAFGDINNDGFLDLYVGNLMAETFQEILDIGPSIELTSSPNNLYLNNGDNTFTDIAELNPIRDTGITFQAVFIDIDNDNNLDIFCGNDFSGGIFYPNSVFINESPMLTFSDISISSKANESKSAMGIALADYNEDGWTDLYITNGGRNTLFKNNGDNTFYDATDDVGVGDDILNIDDSSNDFYAAILNYTAINSYVGQDTFIVELCDTISMNCGNITFIIDVNDIGNTTISQAITNLFMSVPKNASNEHEILVPEVQKGTIIRPPEFGIATYRSDYSHVPSVGWGTNFFDYNNDSYLDLFIANGGLDAKVDNPNTLFKGNASGQFEDVSVSAGIDNPWPARGSIVFDFEQDGDLDIIVVNRPYTNGFGEEYDPNINLYQNNSENENNWLKVELTGTESNKDAIGAKLFACFDGRKLMQIIDGGSSSMSQNSLIAHWGLGNNTVIDSLHIIWPNGCTQSLLNVPSNQKLDVIQECGSSVILAINDNSSDNKFPFEIYPNPSSDFINISLSADFNEEFEFRIFDNSGKQVKPTLIGNSFEAESKTLKISVAELPSGLYSYCLKTKKTNYCNNLAVVR